MHKMIALTVLVLVLSGMVPTAASACTGACRQQGCVDVGFVTGMGCYMVGLQCVETQEICGEASAVSIASAKTSFGGWPSFEPTETAQCATGSVDSAVSLVSVSE